MFYSASFGLLLTGYARTPTPATFRQLLLSCSRCSYSSTRCRTIPAGAYVLLPLREQTSSHADPTAFTHANRTAISHASSQQQMNTRMPSKSQPCQGTTTMNRPVGLCAGCAALPLNHALYDQCNRAVGYMALHKSASV